VTGARPDRVGGALPAVLLPRRGGHGAPCSEPAEALRRGERIEIRGFGSFVVKQREARDGRNPRTGKRVAVAAAVPVSGPGKAARAGGRRTDDGGAAGRSRPDQAAVTSRNRNSCRLPSPTATPPPRASAARRSRRTFQGQWLATRMHAWAPWRMAYIGAPKEPGCIFCDKPAAADQKAPCARPTPHASVMLNRSRTATATS
jgi:hypothetical protein